MCAIIICCLAALLIRRVDHPRAKVPETWMKSLLYELKEICAKLQDSWSVLSQAGVDKVGAALKAGLALVKGTITGSGEPLRSCKWTTFLSAFSRTGSEAQPTAVLEVNGTHAHVPKQIGDQQVLQTTAGKRKRKAKKAKEAEAILDKDFSLLGAKVLSPVPNPPPRLRADGRPTLRSQMTTMSKIGQGRQQKSTWIHPTLLKATRYVVEHRLFSLLTALLTIYALTGDDMRLIFTHQPADPVFDGLTLLCIVVFVLEILLCMFAKDCHP
eukprot:g15899.t1